MHKQLMDLRVSGHVAQSEYEKPLKLHMKIVGEENPRAKLFLR